MSMTANDSCTNPYQIWQQATKFYSRYMLDSRSYFQHKPKYKCYYSRGFNVKQQHYNTCLSIPMSRYICKHKHFWDYECPTSMLAAFLATLLLSTTGSIDGKAFANRPLARSHLTHLLHLGYHNPRRTWSEVAEHICGLPLPCVLSIHHTSSSLSQTKSEHR